EGRQHGGGVLRLDQPAGNGQAPLRHADALFTLGGGEERGQRRQRRLRLRGHRRLLGGRAQCSLRRRGTLKECGDVLLGAAATRAAAGNPGQVDVVLGRQAPCDGRRGRLLGRDGRDRTVRRGALRRHL